MSLLLYFDINYNVDVTEVLSSMKLYFYVSKDAQVSSRYMAVVPMLFFQVYLHTECIWNLYKSSTQRGQIYIVVSDARKWIATKSYCDVTQYWQYI